MFWKKRKMFCLSLLAGVLFFVVLYVQPLQSIQAIKDEIKDLERNNAQLILSDLPQKTITSPGLIIDLINIAEQTNMEIIKFVQGYADNHSSSYLISLSGDYRDFLDCLGIVEDLAYLKNIVELESIDLNQRQENLFFSIGIDVHHK